MRYLGWIVSLAIAIVFLIAYKTQYVPLSQDVRKLESEISMWETVLKDEKGWTGERNRFSVERFFDGNRLSPYAEVEMLRRLTPEYKGIEIYISAPDALTRAHDVVRFFAEQRIGYKTIYCVIDTDSLERFEYKFVK